MFENLDLPVAATADEQAPIRPDQQKLGRFRHRDHRQVAQFVHCQHMLGQGSRIDRENTACTDQDRTVRRFHQRLDILPAMRAFQGQAPDDPGLAVERVDRAVAHAQPDPVVPVDQNASHIVVRQRHPRIGHGRPDPQRTTARPLGPRRAHFGRGPDTPDPSKARLRTVSPASDMGLAVRCRIAIAEKPWAGSISTIPMPSVPTHNRSRRSSRIARMVRWPISGADPRRAGS